MKIAIFNVKYSPNLGDGVIAACLEHELAKHFSRAKIVSIDLAGRTSWEVPGSARKRLARLVALQKVPRRLMDPVVRVLLTRTLDGEIRPTWRRLLDGADIAVFGGGQLIQDGDLNFPLKLAAAADECRRAAIPMALFGVGATPSRSGAGRRLLARFLKSSDLFFAAARDTQSSHVLEGLGVRSSICRDPGLLAARLWPAPPRGERPRPVVGLGITHSVVLKHHSGEGAAPVRPDLIELYRRTVESLVVAGYDVRCFSNGAAEDELAIAELKQTLSAPGDSGRVAGGAISFVPRANHPRDLALTISSCDAIVAHRLHAAIVAYSYRVPHIGLCWDSKMTAFFDSVGRHDFALSLDETTAAAMGTRVTSTIAAGIDSIAYAKVLDETVDGLAALANAIMQRVERRDHAARLDRGGMTSVGSAPLQPVLDMTNMRSGALP